MNEVARVSLFSTYFASLSLLSVGHSLVSLFHLSSLDPPSPSPSLEGTRVTLIFYERIVPQFNALPRMNEKYIHFYAILLFYFRAKLVFKIYHLLIIILVSYTHSFDLPSFIKIDNRKGIEGKLTKIDVEHESLQIFFSNFVPNSSNSTTMEYYRKDRTMNNIRG